MVNYSEILVEGDILLSDNEFYQVIFISSDKKTIDLKSYNRPLCVRGVDIHNLYDNSVTILKEIPKNITFLR